MSPSECARKLLQELNIVEVPIQPREIARQLGIWVWERDIEGGYDGYLMRVENTFGIMVNRAIKSEARKNFTIAHELGHYEFDRHQKFQRACLMKESENFYDNQQEELLANQFAVELLMPREKFIADMKKQEDTGLTAIDALANRYCTSLTSTAIRYARFSPQTCAVVISRDDRIRYFSYSKAFSSDENCYLIKDMPLHAGSYAQQLFDNKLLDEEAAGEVPISYWCKSNATGMLFEQSRSLPRFRQVLSFIWLNRHTRNNATGVQLMLF
jgi:Zn-dependent peptidase ImmA (M78 family)